jgi:hypothetical protein
VACFDALTAGCNACHAIEKVAFFEVRRPELRISLIQHNGAAD